MILKPLLTVLVWLSLCCFIPTEKVIQINITPLLNARPVTTLTQGKLITWTKGIDGDGFADGYLTRAAAIFNQDDEMHALPDQATFAANSKHPVIQLHYDNADSIHAQARFVSGAGEFLIEVPRKHYAQIYLGLSSSEGPSKLQFKLNYTQGQELKNYLLPDYYNNVPEADAYLSYVVTDMAKWGRKNNMTEKGHHNIHLLKLSTDSGRILKSIKISKSKEGYLVFWSATGVTI